jgi:hypothetical protein
MIHSYSHINQIFYKHNKFDDPDSIQSLVQYCLHDGLLEPNKDTDIEVNVEKQELVRIDKPIPTQSILEREEKKEEKEEKEEKQKKQWFLPKQNDTIFWCIYAFIYGQDEYKQIGHSYGNRVLEEKQKIIEYVKKNPKILKSSNVKITNGTVQEILSEFMIDKSTSYYGVAALAIYYKTPIFFINEEKKTYLKFLPESEYLENPTCYLYSHKTERGIPKYKLDISLEKPLSIDTMICLESHLRPFKPISYYKTEDLHTIADKIGFVPKEKMKKQELYEKLCELCGLQN